MAMTDRQRQPPEAETRNLPDKATLTALLATAFQFAAATHIPAKIARRYGAWHKYNAFVVPRDPCGTACRSYMLFLCLAPYHLIRLTFLMAKTGRPRNHQEQQVSIESPAFVHLSSDSSRSASSAQRSDYAEHAVLSASEPRGPSNPTQGSHTPRSRLLQVKAALDS